jgi:hypothetical protein
LKGVTNLLKNREQEIMGEDLLLQEKWMKQNEELKFLKEKKEKEFLENEEMEKFQLISDEVNRRMKTLQIERQQKLLEIERSRAIRLAKEQAEDAMETAEKSALFLKKQELLQQSLGQEGVGYKIEDQLKDTIHFIERENENLYNLEKIHSMKNQELKQQYLNANLKKETANKMMKSHLGRQEDDEDEDQLRVQADFLQKISMNSLGKGPLNNNSNDRPQWMKAPSEIPAPSNDIGLGYGYGVSEPQKNKKSDNNQQQKKKTVNIVTDADEQRMTIGRTASSSSNASSSQKQHQINNNIKKSSSASISSSSAPQFKPAPASVPTGQQQQPQQSERERERKPTTSSSSAPRFKRMESLEEEEEESVHPFSLSKDNDDIYGTARSDLRLPIDEAIER